MSQVGCTGITSTPVGLYSLLVVGWPVVEEEDGDDDDNDDEESQVG